MEKAMLTGLFGKISIGGISVRVLSIPAGGTFQLIKNYEVHAFPNPRSYDYSGYVTFRRKGGIMESLYSVEKTIVINLEEDWLEQFSHLEDKIIDRLNKYIIEREKHFGFSKPEFMFWILEKIEDLYHEPRPVQGYNNHVYFSYEEITSGKGIVIIDSNKKR